MTFNAVWFAKAAACVVGALVAGFVGSLYVGSKLLGPADETSMLEMRSNQSIAAQTKPSPREGASARIQGEPEAAPASGTVPPPVTATHVAPAPESPPPAKGNVADPPAKRVLSDTVATDSADELRLGQQERRRLRAARRKSLENANASLPGKAKKALPEDARDKPFFPFRF